FFFFFFSYYRYSVYTWHSNSAGSAFLRTTSIHIKTDGPYHVPFNILTLNICYFFIFIDEF
ncbi:MAG: hypothetical protein ACTSP6_11315, partial [Promethearchaeota archaeon]